MNGIYVSVPEGSQVYEPRDELGSHFVLSFKMSDQMKSVLL